MHHNADSPKKFQYEQEPGLSVPTAPLQQQLTLPLTPSTPLSPTAHSPLDAPNTNECVVCMEDRVRVSCFGSEMENCIHCFVSNI